MEALRAHRPRRASPTRRSARGRPFLGICVGMQMLFDGSDESPAPPASASCPARVRLLPGDVKRPQMQWNLLERRGDPALLRLALATGRGCTSSTRYAADTDDAHRHATCDYGGPVVGRGRAGNVWATQFHPEKSAATGLAALQALRRALRRRPSPV